MDKESKSSGSEKDVSALSGRDISDFSKDELLAHIDALEMEISGKDGIIQSLQGDLSDSNDQIMNIPTNYRLRLETTVTEQNLTIEALREELELKQKELLQLNEESFSLKDDASTKILELKKELQSKKDQWEQEKGNLKRILENDRETFQTNTKDLESKLDSEINRNLLLEKQVERLFNRLEELYQRDVEHVEELDFFRSQWERRMEASKLSDQAEKPFSETSPDYVESLRNQLAESTTKNAELELLVQSCDRKKHKKLLKAQSEIDSLSAQVDDLKKMNAELETECKNAKTLVEMCKDQHEAELRQLNDVINELCKVVHYPSSSPHEGSLSAESGSSNKDDLFNSPSSVDLVNSLHVKISRCSSEIERYHDRLLEMDSENEVLRKEIDLLSRDSEELGQYKEAVVHLREELEKLKSRSSLVEKNYENSKLSLVKKLESLQIEYSRLENDKHAVTKRLKDELNAVKSSYEELKNNYERLPQLTSTYVQKAHIGTQCDIPNPQNECLKCSEFTCLEVPEHSLSPVSKLTIPSDTTPPKSQSLPPFITSTPYPGHLKGAGESTSHADRSQLDLVKWMEKCQEFSVENIKLKNELTELKVQMKELEVGAAGLLNEQRVLELKRKELETKVAGYIKIKQHCCQMTEKLKMSEFKIAEMDEELKRSNALQEELRNQNANLESKFSELSCFNLGFAKAADASDTLCNELSRKVSEVVLLKSKLEMMNRSNHSLLKKVGRLAETKDLYVIRLEEATSELAACRAEIEVLLDNNVKLVAANKSHDKEVRSLKCRLDYLNELRERHCSRSESESLVTMIQKDMLALCRDAIEKKFECEKLLCAQRKAAQPSTELDARHRVELLMKDNGQLAHEKQDLMLAVSELQKILYDLQKDSGCDEGWLQRIADFETNLMQEIKDTKEQHARIEEALRSTGNLHDELQMEKNDIKNKTIEIAKLEKKLENEKLRVEQLAMQLKLTIEDLNDKNEILKDVKEEKQTLEADLSSVKEALVTAESKLEWERQCNALRLRHAELQNLSIKVLTNFSASSEDEEQNYQFDLDYHKQVYEQVEAQYNQALQTMKHCLAKEFAQKTLEDQASHTEQIEKFRKIVEEQAAKIEKLTSSCIVDELTQEQQATPENRVIFENMDKCKKDINNAMASIENEADAAKIRTSFQEYFNHQLLLAQKILQDEHRSQYSIAVSTLEQLHEGELKLLKLKLEAAYATKLSEQLQEEKPSVSVSFDQENLGRSVSQFIFHIFRKTYFAQIEGFSEGWRSSISKNLDHLENEIVKALNVGEQLDDELKQKALTCADMLLSDEKALISSAQTFVKTVDGFKSDFLQGLTFALASLFDATKTSLEVFKKENSQLRDVVSLREEMRKLEIEKTELDKQCSAALQLLKSDHDTEVKKLDSILVELQHLNQIGCRADALLRLKDELEDKHKREVEELRTYFERKVADLEKNFSEEVFSQHSRKLSTGSSCFDDDSDRDKFATSSSFHCEQIPFEGRKADMLADLSDLFPANVEPLKNKFKPAKRSPTETQCVDSLGCAAKVICRLVLDECRGDVEHELMEAVKKQELLEKFSAQRNQVSTDLRNEGNELGATMVSHTIQKVGFECFKCLKNDIDADFVSRIAAFESLMTDKLGHIQNLLGSKCSKLDQLNRRLGDASKMLIKPASGECGTLEEDTDSSKEVAKLMKDRNNLEKMRNSLRAVVSELSQFLCDSENDLLKQIKDELLELCSDADDGRGSPELKADKHVRFASNLSAIVHELDSTIGESALDWTVDSSTRFREDVHSCMRRLKLEAASLFKLSHQVCSNELDSNKLESEIDALREENAALQSEIARIKAASYPDTDVEEETINLRNVEAVYGDEEAPKSHPSNASYLQNKAKKFLQLIKDAVILKSLEDVLREGDLAIDELQNRCEDLEQQVVLADKQLRSTRQFLEEQAIEREGERDEYSREISSLQVQLKEKDKECSSYIRFNAEVKAPAAQKASPSSRKVDELNKELRDSAERLADSKEREQSLQTELKAAIDRVAVLRDIIRNLEGQISLRNHKETELRNKLDILESELQEKNGTQSIMAHEIEQLRNQSLEDSRGFEQLQALEENIKLKFNSSVIRQFQAQIKEMGKIVDHQTEELERNQVGGASSNSLSSPSEEISIREHIESFNRCKTPEHCPSPVCLPVDEVNKLNEKIVRHARADEVILKKLCDQEIRVDKLTKYAEEMHAERDELNKQKEKLKLQVVEAENKIDYLRHKADATNAAANRDIILENQILKESLSDAEHALAKLKHQLQEKETQLESAEEVIGSLQEKLRSLVQCDENALESLRLELVTMTAERNKLEGLVEKYKNDIAKYGSHPTELRVLLSDKNDEIKLLQDTLSRYQDESGKLLSSRSSKGHRVSFAVETADSESISPEVSRLRDCPGNDSFHFDDPSQLLPLKSSTHRDIEVSSLPKPSFEHQDNISLSKVNENEGDVTKLKSELIGKEEMIGKLEQRLADFQTMEQDLLAARNELQSAITAISADKNYYEEKLTSMMQEIKTKDERCSFLEKSLAEKEVEIEKLSMDIGNLQSLASITQGKLNEAQGLAERDNVVSEVSQSQLASFRKEIGRLTKENSKLESNIAKISAENDALCRKVADFMSENDSLLRKLSEMDSLKQIYDSRCSDMESAKEILEQRLSELNESNQKLKAELSRCESVKNHLEQTQDHLNSILKENESLQSTLGSMSSDFERLSFENRILKETVQSKTTDLQTEVAQLRQEVDSLSATLKTEKELKNELKKKCEALSLELESFKSERQGLSVEKDNLADENSALKQQLEGLMSSVRSLRGELSSLKKKDTPYISVLASIDCDEVKKLYFEVSKLISDVGKLEFERNCLQQQLAKMRSIPEGAPKEDEVGRLSEQISRLEVINAELKENNKKHTEQLQAEIAKLAHEIKYMQMLEQQANDKLIASVAENQRISTKLVEMEKLVGRPVREEKRISEKGLQVTILPQLRRTSTQIVERVPEAVTYLEDQRVATTSTSPTIMELDRAVESALYDKVRTIEDLKNRLGIEESQTRALRLEKLDLDLNMKTMEKINALQEKKLDMISAKFKQLSDDHLRLELELQSEKTSRLHLENELKTQQMKKQSSQMENLDILENMNARLKLAMENEAKLKSLVLEKHQQCEDAIARFNGVMVMERYKTESENEGYSCSPQKRFAEVQENCRFLQCELEKQERLNEDLKAVLSRERRTLLSAQERMKSLESECNKLHVDLKNEIAIREDLLKKQNEEVAQDKVEADDDQLISLQHENDRLREKLEIFQELLEQRRAHSLSPALEQLKELNMNVECLSRRQRELQTVNRNLEDEHDFLAGQIAQMREERTNMRLSSERMDFAPSVSAKLDIYLGRYFRAESYRKSLVSQKKYLTAVLRGFERSHNMTLTALVRGRNTPRKRPSFRGVVQTVIATTRMKFLVRKRKVACESAYIGLLRALGFTSEDAIARVGYSDASAGPSMHPLSSNSPPTKERPPSEASRRRRMPAVPHSQYLAALQEVQKLTR